jgi:hypothetical protein
VNRTRLTAIYYERQDGMVFGMVQEIPSISAVGAKLGDVRGALTRLVESRLKKTRARAARITQGKKVLLREILPAETRGTAEAARPDALPANDETPRRAEVHRGNPEIRSPFTAVHLRRKGRRNGRSATIVSFAPEVPGALSEASTIEQADANLAKAVELVLAHTFRAEWAWWFPLDAAHRDNTPGADEFEVLAVAPLSFRSPAAPDGENS